MIHQIDNKIYRNCEIVVILENDFFGTFYVIEDEILLQSYHGYFIFKNLKIEGFYCEGNLEFLSFTDTNRNLTIFKDQKFITTNIKGSIFFKDGFFISVDESFIFFYKSVTSESVYYWKFSIQTIGNYLNKRGRETCYSVEKIIGIWNNEILIGFSNSLIVSLDIETGKEIRRWQVLDGYYQDIRGVANQIPASNMFLYDDENGKLIALQLSSYVEIDLSTSQVIVKSLNDEMDKIGILHLNNQTSYGISSSHLFTTASGTDYKLDESFQNIIAINRKSFEIDWSHRFAPEDEGVNGTPVYESGKLYQLTGAGTLYVFDEIIQ